MAASIVNILYHIAHLQRTVSGGWFYLAAGYEFFFSEPDSIATQAVASPAWEQEEEKVMTVVGGVSVNAGGFG